MARNENFNGTVSFMGHSLGSVILFDILSHQSEAVALPTGTIADSGAPVLQQQTSFTGGSSAGGGGGGQVETLEGLFNRLGLAEYTDAFVREGIDLLQLTAANEADLEEAGMPQEARTKLLKHLQAKKNAADGLQEHQANSVTSDIR